MHNKVSSIGKCVLLKYRKYNTVTISLLSFLDLDTVSTNVKIHIFTFILTLLTYVQIESYVQSGIITLNHIEQNHLDKLGAKQSILYMNIL